MNEQIKENIINSLLYFTETNKIQTIKYVINKEEIQNREEIFYDYILTLFKQNIKLNTRNINSKYIIINVENDVNTLIIPVYTEESLKNYQSSAIIKMAKSQEFEDIKIDKIILISFNGYNKKDNLNNVKLIDIYDLLQLISYLKNNLEIIRTGNINQNVVKLNTTTNLKTHKKITINEELWELRFKEFKEYNNKVKNKEMIDDKEKALILNWVNKQRYYYSKNNLTPTQIERLELEGVIFNRLEFKWNEAYQNVLEFYKKNGFITIPHDTKENEFISKWLHRQTAKIREGTLEEEKKIKILNLGISPTSTSDSWNSKYEELKQIYEQNKKIDGITNNNKLSKWVYQQKRLFSLGKLSPEKTEKLKALNFNFTIKDN